MNVPSLAMRIRTLLDSNVIYDEHNDTVKRVYMSRGKWYYITGRGESFEIEGTKFYVYNGEEPEEITAE